jgi:PPOX class probable FMN-dependent enzyme
MDSQVDQDGVLDEDELREPYRSQRFMPILDQLDRSFRYFIAHSPMVVIGTSHPEYGLDVSPRGDAPGFVRVLDDRTLAIPDRTGNNRLDSMTNLLEDDRIGLFFMIPGVHETLRIKGRARISRDPELIEAAIVDGKAPNSVILVTVEQAYVHCGKALLRSHLWKDTYRADPQGWQLARATLENSDGTDIEIR